MVGTAGTRSPIHCRGQHHIQPRFPFPVGEIARRGDEVLLHRHRHDPHADQSDPTRTRAVSTCTVGSPCSSRSTCRTRTPGRSNRITIDTWWPEIEAFLRLNITNARTEGSNRIIKQLKRVGCGFSNHATTNAVSSLARPHGKRRDRPDQRSPLTRNHGEPSTGGGSWTIDVAQEPVDLGFLRDLPANGAESLTLHSSDEAKFGAVAHLAPGLRKLYLVWAGFSDAALGTVARLTGLTYLQTFGNDFRDVGVQKLAALVNLDHLYLEEETLTAAAFAFVDQLPHLARLGLQDVWITPDELSRLRERLPGVDVG
jgi:hypothetical protein